MRMPDKIEPATLPPKTRLRSERPALWPPLVWLIPPAEVIGLATRGPDPRRFVLASVAVVAVGVVWTVWQSRRPKRWTHQLVMTIYLLLAMLLVLPPGCGVVIMSLTGAPVP